MLRSCGRLIGVSRGTMTRGRRSFSATSADRSIRLRDSPCATPASVFIEQGTITIASQGEVPLAIAAPRSRLRWTISASAAYGHAVARRQVRDQAVDRRFRSQLVGQQAPPEVRHHQIHPHVRGQQRRQGTHRVQRPARARDADRHAQRLIRHGWRPPSRRGTGCRRSRSGRRPASRATGPQRSPGTARTPTARRPPPTPTR